jgi:GT2 family glycosyltransferase
MPKSEDLQMKELLTVDAHMDPEGSIGAASLKLSIVLGTYNRLSSLTNCLDSIIGKISVAHQIIVVDAGSTDGTIEYLQSLDCIVLVQDGQRLGQAKSLNRVFRRLISEYVCWISDDNIVVPEELEKAVSTMESNPAIGMLSLKVKDIAGPFIGAPYIGGFWESGVLNVNQGLVRRSVLCDVDYFDEEFRDYGIDADLTTKILLAGHQVAYTKNVVIFHNRDYEQAPGAIDAAQRSPRTKRAKELYRKKYAQEFRGVRRILPQRFGSVLLLFYKSLQLVKRAIGRPSPGLFHFNERDWHNVSNCPFMYKLDLWLNKDKDYYLVQKIHKRN